MMAEILLSILVGIAVEVIAYFICKWLDKRNKK